jgi:hypothetical protein
MQVRMLRSSGLPSSDWTAASAGVCVQPDGNREQTVNTQIAGINNARDVWTFRSRFSRKSPQIPTAQTMLAISVGVTASAGFLAFGIPDSICVHEKAVYEFQGQKAVNLAGIVSRSL